MLDVCVLCLLEFVGLLMLELLYYFIVRFDVSCLFCAVVAVTGYLGYLFCGLDLC